MKHSKGYRTRSRNLFSAERARKGLSVYLRKYEIGNRVHININPASLTTAPHRRFQGLTGIIIGKRGHAYIIRVNLGNEERTVITTPEHLEPAG
ncbi:MAG: 50S ribosomal protein L21e [Thermoprotei archaeon]